MKKPLSIVLIIIALAGIAFGIWGTVRANGLQDALDKKIAEVGPQFEALKAQGDEAVAAVLPKRRPKSPPRRKRPRKAKPKPKSPLKSPDSSEEPLNIRNRPDVF